MRDVWKDYINIYWDLPESDGGSPITGYNIEVRDAFEISFKYVGTVDANTVHYQVSVQILFQWKTPDTIMAFTLLNSIQR